MKILASLNNEITKKVNTVVNLWDTKVLQTVSDIFLKQVSLIINHFKAKKVSLKDDVVPANFVHPSVQAKELLVSDGHDF